MFCSGEDDYPKCMIDTEVKAMVRLRSRMSGFCLVLEIAWGGSGEGIIIPLLYSNHQTT